MSILNMVTPGKHQMQNIHEFNVHEDPIPFAKHVGNMPDLVYYQVKKSIGFHDYVADVECGFDIETTTVKEETTKTFIIDGKEETRVIYPKVNSYMYIWQFTFRDMVVFGRTWEEWLFTLNTIQSRYPELGEEIIGRGRKKCKQVRRVIMWIANAGFEFQFISRLMYNGKPLVRSVFADKTRSPLNVSLSTTDKNCAFSVYDALRVGSLSLAKLADDYCVTKKMVGDLDYSVMRNSVTPLTDKELAYCRNDVVILNEWARFYLDAYVKQCGFAPLTQTGIVRQAIRERFTETKYDPFFLRSLFPKTVSQYIEVRNLLYKGGRVGSNAEETGKIHDDVESRDFTSSYPACILQEKFPMKPFLRMPQIEGCKDKNVFNAFVNQLDAKYAWYVKIRFYDIKVTTAHSVESISKIEEYYDNGCNKNKTRTECVIVEDNGKIRAAQQITVMLTDLDYETYKDFYEWKSVEVLEFNVSEYEPLPVYITDVVKHFYKLKAQLKRAGKDGTIEYCLAKAMVNSIYGLMCQKLNLEAFNFEPSKGWTHTVTKDPDALQNEYMEQVGLGQYAFDKSGNIKKPRYLMSPYHGVWVCAWARRRLYLAIKECGPDCLYTDTDSIYFKNSAKHLAWFDKWNKEVDAKNKALFGNDYDELGDLGTFDPVVIKGKDDNGNPIKSKVFTFKTLGAKRYLKYDKYGNVEQTVAGLPKEALQNKVASEHPDFTKMEIAKQMMDEFRDGMIMDIGLSDKRTSRYNDAPHSDVVVDPYGNTEVMHSESSLAIYDIPFKLKVDDYFKALLLYLSGVEV